MMIFGFRPENWKTKAVAVALSIAWLEDDVELPAAAERARERQVAFRRELYRCLTRRADELAELADAVPCASGPVRVLAELSLVPEHRRGHDALYDALNSGQVQIARLVAGCVAAAGLARWADPAGGGCEWLAAARCGDQPGAVVLPLLRAAGTARR